MRAAPARLPGAWVAGATLLALGTGPALEAHRWTPALVVVGLGVLGLAWCGPAPTPSRAHAVALACATGWAAWSTASIGWAQDQGWAWEAAGRAWLATGILAALVLWPGTAPPRARAAVAAATVALAAAGQAVIAWVATLDGTPLADGRLRGALPYANGLAVLMVAGTLSALGLAGGARTAKARGAWTAVAVLLACTGLAAQSRSSVPVLLVGLLVAAGCGGLRRSALVALLGCAAAVAASAGAVLSLRTVVLDGGDVVQRAGEVLPVVGTAALLAAVVAMLGGPRHGRRSRRPRALPGTVRAGILVVALAAALTPPVLAVTSRERVDYDRIEKTASTRFSGGAASNRPDMWRVAWDVLRDRPVGGVGAGSFERPYLRLREADVAPRFAHSFPAEAASTLGLPGLALAGAAVLALLVGALAAARTSVEGAWVAAAGCAILAHALIDWTAELPLVAALALVALTAGPAPPDPVRRSTRAGPRALGVLLVAAALAMVPVAVAAALTHRQPLRTPAEVAARLDRLELAARLAPLDPRPLEIRALVALRSGHERIAREAAAEALARDPDHWFALWLGGWLAHREDPRRSRALLAGAARQNPAERVLALTSATRQDRPLDLRRALELLRPEG